MYVVQSTALKGSHIYQSEKHCSSFSAVSALKLLHCQPVYAIAALLAMGQKKKSDKIQDN